MEVSFLVYIAVNALKVLGRVFIGGLDPRRWRLLLGVILMIALAVGIIVIALVVIEPPKDPCSDASASIDSLETVCGTPDPYVEIVFKLGGLRSGCRPWIMVQQRASGSFLPPSSPTAMKEDRWLAFAVLAAHDEQYLAYIVAVRQGAAWGTSLPEGAVILDRRRVDGDCTVPVAN